MASRRLTSRELTLGYLSRIGHLNPLVHAVIETNPQAVSIAARLDNERRAGRVRGLLHGIPVIVKDNIATGDTMQTTAGSLALFTFCLKANILKPNMTQKTSFCFILRSMNRWKLTGTDLKR